MNAGSHPALRTKLCSLLGIDMPLVQPGMGWVADGRLTAATSEAGGLGIIGAATMTLTELRKAIELVKSKTARPFGVNLRSDAPDVEERVKLMIAERVPIASFALAPGERLLKTLKDAGIFCMPSVGARRHAEKLAGWGADAVIVQGGEAGGHTGSVATTVLLPQIVDAVDIPVIAAGGFFDGRGLVAALSYGAVGIAMGTRMLMTAESPVPAPVKAVYLQRGVADTVVTDQIDGHPHRVLRTAFIDKLVSGSGLRDFGRAFSSAAALRRTTGISPSGLLRQAFAVRREHGYSWRQVVMAANTPVLLRKTMIEGEVEFGIISGGQVTGLISDVPTVAELVDRVMREATAVLQGLCSAACLDAAGARG
jgi:NAD(P)H-dependent flavin oxidoreductase YrpB (nitropropane dioxygenase family)